MSKLLDIEEVCDLIDVNPKDLINHSGEDIVRMARLENLELRYLGDSLWEVVEEAAEHE